MTTLDPISLKDVRDPLTAPHLTVGDGDGEIMIFFESEHNKQVCKDKPPHGFNGEISMLNPLNVHVNTNFSTELTY
jgi:hypothetical protein